MTFTAPARAPGTTGDVDPVDYDLPVAPYVQVAAQIRALVESGAIPAGGKIPSESRIVQETGVARSTARRAVRLLRDEGIVVTAPGYGSYARHLPGDHALG